MAEPSGGLERVTIALVPSSIGTEAMADAGMAVGMVSAGHGIRPPAQTFLDIGQGARVSDSLYGSDLPDVVRLGRGGVAPRAWSRIRDRAESAPADLVPGLLAQTIGPRQAGAAPSAELGALIAADRSGRTGRGGGLLRVVGARADELGRIASKAGPEHLVIALAVPKARGQRLVAGGFAGAGYRGVLTSRTTRLDGLISAIDIAPTVVELLGAEPPSEMDGRSITSDPGADAADVEDLRARLLELSPRRTPVVWLNAGIWVALAGLASVAFGRRGRELALPWLAVTIATLPAMLLVGSALQPSELAERLVVGIGSPAIAWALVRQAGAYGGFAIAAAASVGGYAIDVVAGSRLTALTVGGSNPSSGVRFFGIGNEHEAALSGLTLAGAGAALAAWGRSAAGRTIAVAFAAAAILAVLAFAPGRFGADVGAAITIPGGAAVAIALALGAGRRGWALVLLAPVAGLAALIAIDLISGGDAHLSRSVLDAEDAGEVADVIETRLRLAWHSVERNAGSPFLWAAVALLALLAYRRSEVRSVLEAAPRPALAGLAGAAATVVVGTLANDSGVTLFIIGSWFVLPFAALVWVIPHPDDGASGPPSAGRNHG